MSPKSCCHLSLTRFIVDRSGKFSIVGIWEAINAPNFPAVHPQLFIVTGWKGDALATLMTETRIWTPASTLLGHHGADPAQISVCRSKSRAAVGGSRGDSGMMADHASRPDLRSCPPVS